MTDGPHWFAPKRYGYGAGMPVAWQGWAVLLAYVGLLSGAAFLLQREPVALIAVAIPLTVMLLLIAARTTRGGWRWRWGNRD